ncbi:MAG: sporulation protein YabP [Oscillospiraceae bacterium]|nr:sporulation protein YabP [Oscillospiraceae bacterium]
MKEPQSRTHSAVLENRSLLTLTGVTEIVRFDDRAAVLYTALGELTVLGSGLTVSELSTETGGLRISGEISALRYGDRDRTASRGLIGRLLR